MISDNVEAITYDNWTIQGFTIFTSLIKNHYAIHSNNQKECSSLYDFNDTLFSLQDSQLIAK